MSVPQSSPAPAPRWFPNGIELLVVVLIVGALSALVARAVAKARNAAESSGTT
jgi:hypothetical protein